MLKHTSIHKWTNIYVYVETLLRKASIFSESTFSTKCEKNLRAHLQTHTHTHTQIQTPVPIRLYQCTQICQSGNSFKKTESIHEPHRFELWMFASFWVVNVVTCYLWIHTLFITLAYIYIYIYIYICMFTQYNQKDRQHALIYVNIHMYTYIYTDTYIYICTNTHCVYLYVASLSVCLSSMLVRVCVCMCKHCTHT